MCRCEPNATIQDLLDCTVHLAGHTLIGCQICGSSVCRLFFRNEPEVEIYGLPGPDVKRYAGEL